MTAGFAGIFLYDTLQHVKNREKVLIECVRILKNDGVIVLIEWSKKQIEEDFINYEYLMVLANRYIKIKDTRMAILVMRNILMIYKNDEKTLFFLAHLYMFEKKINRAKKTLYRLRNSEFKFVKYKNLHQLDWGMHNLLDFRVSDYSLDFFKELFEDSFEDW